LSDSDSQDELPLSNCEGDEINLSETEAVEPAKNKRVPPVEPTTGSQAEDSDVFAGEDRISPPRRRSWGHHVYLLVISALVVGLSLAMHNDGPSQVFLPFMDSPLPDLCSFKRIFGRGCPGCGLTRAFINIGHLDFARAWMFNPSAFVLYPLIAFQIPWRLTQLIRIRTGKPELDFPKMWIVTIVLVSAVFVQWLVKLVLSFTVQ